MHFFHKAEAQILAKISKALRMQVRLPIECSHSLSAAWSTEVFCSWATVGIAPESMPSMISRLPHDGWRCALPGAR